MFHVKHIYNKKTIEVIQLSLLDKFYRFFRK